MKAQSSSREVACSVRIPEPPDKGCQGLAGMKRGFWSSVLVRENPHTIMNTAQHFTAKGGNGCH
jgi:hypothetical protein